MMAFLIPVASASCPAPAPPATCEAASGASWTTMYREKAGTTPALCCTTGVDCSTVSCASGTTRDDSVNYGTTSTCCKTAITGRCSGNTDSTEDVTCPSGQALKGFVDAFWKGMLFPAGTDAATCCEPSCSAHTCGSGTMLPSFYSSILTGSSDSQCCYTTQYCTGNSGSYGNSNNRIQGCELFSDHDCSSDKILKSGASSIAGTTDSECCENSCALASCDSGYHHKADASSIRGSTNSVCCDADITGKCSGNTNWVSDFSCYSLTNKVPKSNSDSITGSTAEACCDTSCSSVTCESGRSNKGSGVAGTTTSACCETSCSSVTTCGTNQGHLGNYVVGSTTADCCEDVVSGKCAGNTNSPYEVSCDSNKALDYTCADFDCGSMCTGCTSSNAEANNVVITTSSVGHWDLLRDGSVDGVCGTCCETGGSDGSVDGATQSAVSAVIITAVLSFTAMS